MAVSNGTGPVVALVGNPNVGKSTVFNALTNLRQHTGNWPGKTVETARGAYTYHNRTYTLVDLPGAYSLHPGSAEEEVTRDYLLSGEADVTLVVADATCLTRNLALVLQILEAAWPVVLCVNLLDEAEKKGIIVSLDVLRRELGCPVVGAAARGGQGLDELRQTLEDAALRPGPRPERRLENVCQGCGECMTALVMAQAEAIAGKAVDMDPEAASRRDRRLDRLLTSRKTGIPVMLLLLAGILYLCLRPGDAGAWAVVTEDGRETARYPLSEERTVTLGEDDYNVLRISGGAAAVIEANCGDNTCVRMGEISREGESIVCLPHRLVIRIEGGEARPFDADVG